jgi:hypothetical protein
MKNVKEHWPLGLIVLIFFGIQLSSLFYARDLWWDASVYVGMGKYIFSLGHAGLWESERPLIWPLMLGFLWKLGLNEIMWGKILTFGFSIGCIVLTYCIGQKYFNKTTALISSLFLAFTPLFFLYTTVLQTEIPATFFLLLGIYYYEKKPFLTGILFGVSMMTRFFQVIIISSILVYTLLKKREKIVDIITGFGIPVSIFCITNIFLYHDPFYPFTLQVYMTQNTGWIFYQPWWYYFVELFKENLFFIVTIAGIYFILKEKKLEKIFIVTIFIVGFIPFIFEKHKETRLLISLLPFLIFLTVYGLTLIVEHIQNIHKKKIVYVILMIVWALYTIPLLHFNTYDDHLDFFYDALADTSLEEIWISNPSMIAYTNKTAELIYFPLYNTEKIYELNEKISEAHMILLNSCDILPCPPLDTTCTTAHNAFIKSLQQNFNTAINSSGECDYFIFYLNNDLQ